jgi:hypothetical protein
MNLLKLFVVSISLLIVSNTFAQFEIDAELRPRYEYRHGYKTLFPNKTDAASFVSQRTRVGTKYSTEKLRLYVSIQNVRAWGDVPQLNISDKNGIGLHEAWGEIIWSPNVSLKLGRQEVIYDDHRIFGNVGWAQQARSHDLALIKYAKNQFKMNIGVAFNQSGENLVGTELKTPKTYKKMQHVWLHKKWDKLAGSLLFLNNGMQTSSGTTKYSQTLGTHLVNNGNKWQTLLNAYYQFGKDAGNRDLSAYLLGLEINHKTSKSIALGLGAELQSGNDKGKPTQTKNKAFNPFYGTNHKFNGFMDYFYVGNHTNNVGLLDVYAKAKTKLSSKSSLSAFVHSFSAAADLDEKVSNQLGTEVDLVYSYKHSKEISLSAGYSHMFASKGMKVLKASDCNSTNNWGWVMVTIKPTLFSTKNL